MVGWLWTEVCIKHVHPVLPGKSSTATALAQHYQGACLSVDAVVTDVLINGNSLVSLTARQLYENTVAEYAERKAQDAGEYNLQCL